MVYASKKYADLGISVGQSAKTCPAVFWFAVVASFVGILMLLFCAVSKDNIFFLIPNYKAVIGWYFSFQGKPAVVMTTPDVYEFLSKSEMWEVMLT